MSYKIYDVHDVGCYSTSTLFSSYPGDPRSLTMTPGHVKFVKSSWEQYAKDHVWKFLVNCFKLWHMVFWELLSRPYDKIKMIQGWGRWPRD